MNDETEQNVVGRLTQSGQDTLQRVSTELLQNPVVGAALTRAMAAKAKADAVGAGVLAQLNVATADDVAALRTRLRSVATRAEKIDAKLDDVLARLERIEAAVGAEPAASTVPRQPRTRARRPEEI